MRSGESSIFANRVVEICERELHLWSPEGSRADQQPYSGIVGEYWRKGLNISRRDGTTEYVDPGGRRFRPAWSAAFISYVYRLAGAGEHFLYHEAHIHYIVKALRDAEAAAPSAFLARDPALYPPRVGDLVIEVRGRAIPLDRLSSSYGSSTPPFGAFIPTHSDVVVEINPRDARLRTIGGNLFGGIVGERGWRLGPVGILEPTDRLLCIIQCGL